MKNKLYILFTAGRGPVECGIAVKGIQKKFRKYLSDMKVEYRIVNHKNGDFKESIETIIIELEVKHRDVLAPWLGTLQWICQSPIRKYHKRKNWFVKCDLIEFQEELEILAADVVFQTYRASGPGGQHRNKVETAVRLKHIKSGLIVTASDGKSQAQNRKKAWEKLHAKIQSMNSMNQSAQCTDQWINQIEIERGNPIKIFEGMKFRELKKKH